MTKKNESCLKCKDLQQDNERAWQKVADLHARNQELSTEVERLSRELARTYG